MDSTALPPSLRQERALSLIVAVSFFMQNLDGTVLATALPAMAHAFGEDAVHMNVALTAYLFAIALFVPASGWAADRFGARPVFAAAIATFTLGSALCGLSTTLPALVASRIVQGIGGAMMLPVGRLVILRAVPKSRLVAAMAWVTVPALVGPVIGPPLGGLIVTYASWPWIFYINLPIGLLGTLYALRIVPASREPHPGPLDWTGLLLSGLTLAGFMAFLELAGRNVIPRAGLAALAAGSVAAGLLYAAHARRRPRPLLDLTLMRIPSFSVSVVAGSFFRLGVGAQPFLLPLLIQLGFGASALRSGAITFAGALGAIGMKPATSWALGRFGFRRTLVVNGALCAALLALAAAFRPAWPLPCIYAVLLASGFLRSLQFTAFNTIAYADIPPDRMSAATTFYAALQQVSLTIGIPISAGILQLLRAGPGAPRLATFSAAFLTVAALSALASPAALALPRGAGRDLH